MKDPRDLYKEILLRHSHEPRGEGALEEATHKAELKNPLCGDEIAVYLIVEDGRLRSFSFEAKSCSICKASASMLTQRILDCDAGQAVAFSRKFIEALENPNINLPLSQDDPLWALEGVKGFMGRIRCATLPWEAFLEALGLPAADDHPAKVPKAGEFE